MLDLEVAGVVTELAEGERAPAQPPPRIAKLRDSHHAVARLMAKGLRDEEISFQSGYGPQRIFTLRQDPLFMELVAHYRRDAAHVAAQVEEQFLLVAQDARAILHDRVLDAPDEISTGQALEIFKVFADRAGFAPVQRTVNKNMNLNIGARLDAARARQKDEAA